MRKLSLLLLVFLCACQKEKPLSFPVIQKFQVSAGDLFYFRGDGQLVLLERRNAYDVAASAAGSQASSVPGKVTVSSPVQRKPGDFWGAGGDVPMLESKILSKDYASITRLTFSPSGRFLAGGSPDGQLVVWDVHSGDLTVELQQSTSVVSLVFSPDERQLAVGLAQTAETAGSTVRLIQFPSGIVESRFGYAAASALAFSSRGVLVAGFENGQFTLFSPPQESPALIRASESPLVGLAVHPTDAVVATAHADKTILLWDTALSKKIGTLNPESPTNPLFARGIERIAFNGNGSQLATAYADGQLVVWDMAALQTRPRE
jgi:hypothetical protein